VNQDQNDSQNGYQNSWRILWEDNDLLVVSKPVGLLVDSGRGSNDLVSSIGGGVFAFHRLDRETSGIVMLGKTRRFAKEITSMFEEKRIRKGYMAVVAGEWSSTRIEEPIEDRVAVTTFRRFALGNFGGTSASWIEALPKTGRTHQIRLHCAGAGHAILGDEKYGVVKSVPDLRGQALHAYRLDFRHPANGETVAVKSPPIEWRSSWLAEFDFEPTWAKLF
jgi:23S rRNA pseudouridine955/2504/2580 synthase